MLRMGAGKVRVFLNKPLRFLKDMRTHFPSKCHGDIFLHWDNPAAYVVGHLYLCSELAADA